MKKNLLLRILLISIPLCLLTQTELFAQDTTQYITSGRQNTIEQQNKPYVILISVDGFRHDLAEKYHAKHLLQFANNGVRAVSMRPSYPSLTFPNHYAMITGMYPSHNGIVDNLFYDSQKKTFYKVGDKKAVLDSSWYGGEPLWVLSEKQKMLSASFYWVGSDSHIGGIPPTYFYHFNEAINIDRRINILKDWLEKPAGVSPHFITFYFPEVDHMEHLYGVDSKQTEQAVAYIDSSIQKIYEVCQRTGLPINYIFVSDHGFANMDTTKTMSLPAVIDTSKFIIAKGGEIVHLYSNNKSDIISTYQAIKHVAVNYRPYLISKTPKDWHYRKKDDHYNRMGDIILVPNPPYSFYFGGYKKLGAHGFDNRLADMQATFFAWGPAFKNGLTIGNFDNVHIYPLIAHILGLPIVSPIDGRFKVLKKILK